MEHLDEFAQVLPKRFSCGWKTYLECKWHYIMYVNPGLNKNSKQRGKKPDDHQHSSVSAS